MNDPNTFLLVFIAATGLVNTYLLSTRKRRPIEIHHLDKQIHFIIQKLNTIMADSAQIKQQVADLKAQVATLQSSVDAEQAAIQSLLDSNAQVVTDLNTQITALQAQLAGSPTPEDLQAISDGLTEVANSIVTTKEDIEGTVS
jgi:septal ring factor EnvC (AmiA/AmiB activator)